MQKTLKNPLSVIQAQALATLKSQIAMVRDAQKAFRAKDGPIDVDGTRLKSLTDQSGAIGRAVAALLAEARKQEEHVKHLVSKLSQEERVELVLTFLDDLPIEHRKAIRLHLEQMDERL